MEINRELWDAIYHGDSARVESIVEQEIASGVDAVALMNTTMIPALRDIGEAFSAGEVFIPEMLVGARALQTGMDLLEPLLVEEGNEPIAKVCIGTVKGDLHDIGKNLVTIMLRGSGFEVEDIGVNCEIEDYAAAVERGSRVVCLSALLSTTRDQMRPVIDYFSNREDVKVVVGGAAVTRNFAQEIGADEFGEDASDAVRAVRSCLGMAA
ncbi:MAG: cobalamin-dependent protein [Xanthomonadales bacterium]|jgi:5-methyltetrahydrofolate--homocysteine methyltransferase|nr:cobalamin-dependent protein [Xanthomonadales bacterium]